MFDGVHGRTLFAAVSTRAGGVARVDTISRDTVFRRHDFPLSKKASDFQTSAKTKRMKNKKQVSVHEGA